MSSSISSFNLRFWEQSVLLERIISSGDSYASLHLI